MFKHTVHTARGRYHLGRGIARATARLVILMRAGVPAEAVATFIRNQQPAVSMNLSWRIEDAAAPGTFAEAVFNVLAG